MKISKEDALMWVRFFADVYDEEDMPTKQLEIGLAVLSQIEVAEEKRQADLMAQIPGLKSLCGRTLYVGPDERFSKGCRGCLTGTGLTAIRKTNQCNLQCPFCYDYGCLDEQEPVGEGMWEIGGTRYREEDIELLLDIHKKPSGVCYVYLEPFMEIEQYYGIISRFRRAGVHQHMYTNGTLATPENLRALGEAGLDELRFNLGATDCSDRVIANIAEAKRHIPWVGIETPMTPGLYESFLKKKDAILATGVDFINFAELHIGKNNVVNYIGEPMYMTRLGYISPIWSRELTLRMMRTAALEQWPCTVHDCSNRTKFARSINARAQEGSWFGDSLWGPEFPSYRWNLFLPTLEDADFAFVEEEPMPVGYRPSDIVL